MSNAPISDEIALRIGLAARQLPDTDPRRLLRVLEDAVGLPPTAQKLATLTPKEFKAAAGGEFAGLDGAAVKSALACLKGEHDSADAPPLPVLEAYTEGEMPGSLRVACASNKEELLDGHFGSCLRFLIYQVSREEIRLVDLREVEDRDGVEEKNSYRASLVGDCQLLFVVSIGGPAAAKVVRAGVHPVKRPRGGDARDELASLQRVIGKGASPWLAKAMGQAPEERVRFVQEA